MSTDLQPKEEDGVPIPNYGQYALMPTLFYLDDYDNCLLLGDEALYCTFSYQVAPIEKQNPSTVWKIIEEVSSDPFNYRHDVLRHGVCMSVACPNITIDSHTITDEGLLRRSIEKCYDEKYVPLGIQGKIIDLHCQTNKPLYSIDSLDIIIGIMYAFSIALVIFASFYEGIARYKPTEDYERIVGTKFGKLMSALSVCKNWIRLKTVAETEDVNALRSIQGIRFYNMTIVIFCHTVMISLMGPVSNTKYLETLRENFLTIFMNSGAYAVQTFFMLSGWLLTYHVLVEFDGKKEFTLKHIMMAFVQRYLRLTPTLLAVLAFHSTWLRHMNRGPIWDQVVGTEFRRCRKNWWTNILYINTFIDPYYMCMPHTWYLCVDTQLFICELLILWLLLKFKKQVALILGTIATVGILVLFIDTYVRDLDPVVWPYPEYMYMFRVVAAPEWHVIMATPYANFAGLVTGICYGYAFYEYKRKKLFARKIDIWIWWIICLCCPLGIIIIPGLWIYDLKFEHNIWFSATYIALGRLIFSIGIGYIIFGVSRGVGWVIKWICEWPPTYVLGRLSYSSYLIHVSLAMIRGAMRRERVHVADYIIICEMFGDVAVGIVGATLLTLFVEMPAAAVLKIVLPVKNRKTAIKEEEDVKSK